MYTRILACISVSTGYTNVLNKINILLFKLHFSFNPYLKHDPDLSFAVTEYFPIFYMNVP